MKITKYIFLIGALNFFSCSYSKKETNDNSEEVENFINKNLKPGKPFFHFDAVDYYKNNIDENTATNLLNNQSTTLDSIKYNLIIDKTSENLSDEYFINNLTKAGYKKTKINSLDFQQITNLFSEQPEREGLDFACIPKFRDILVFKKNEKVIGAAKICFGCNDYKIIGTNADTKNFGQGKDYENLSLILNKYSDKK